MYDDFSQKLQTQKRSVTRKEREEGKERTSITGIVNVNRSWGCWVGQPHLLFVISFSCLSVECVYIPLIAGRISLSLEFPVCEIGPFFFFFFFFLLLLFSFFSSFLSPGNCSLFYSSGY